MAVILGIITVIAVLVLELLAMRMEIAFMRWIKKYELQFGSQLMAAFLSGFIVFVLFTGRMPNPWQKIPVILVSALLIWANLFLGREVSSD
jgi:drug/metabolite transporter (DMT)-like permease